MNPVKPEGRKRASYVIAYDLEVGDYDYGPLTQLLTDFKAIRILSSVWLISGNIRMTERLFREVRNCMPPEDRLFIHEISIEGTYDNLLVSDDEMINVLYHCRRSV
jgi:hypothetical protein